MGHEKKINGQHISNQPTDKSKTTIEKRLQGTSFAFVGIQKMIDSPKQFDLYEDEFSVGRDWDAFFHGEKSDKYLRSTPSYHVIEYSAYKQAIKDFAMFYQIASEQRVELIRRRNNMDFAINAMNSIDHAPYGAHDETDCILCEAIKRLRADDEKPQSV